jgi:chemotaxis protein methyltransferase CheR
LEDRECVAFLRWALPRLRLRWAGFRKVRRQVCRRLSRRLRALSLPDLDSYRAHLAEHPAEWEVLDGLCRIPISRFHRDRAVWEALAAEVLPAVARGAQDAGRDLLTAWSAGCASGEEPYSLIVLWELGVRRAFPDLSLRVLATDSDPALLERARRGEYGASSLKDFPPVWLDAAFERSDGRFRVRPALREPLELRCSDLRGSAPGDGPFDLVLCRNLAFTYFDEALQRETAAKLSGVLREGGALVLGRHESLPAEADDLAPWLPQQGIHRRRPRERARSAAPTGGERDAKRPGLGRFGAGTRDPGASGTARGAERAPRAGAEPALICCGDGARDRRGRRRSPARGSNMPAKVPVKNWMSGDPVAVEPSASALEALDRMTERGIRHLPVIDPQRRVVGVLSLDDLRAALPFPVALRGAPDPTERELAREWSVADVMTHAPETVGEDVSLAEAAQRMASGRIGCLPVVDAGGRLSGLLSETDVLHALVTSLWSDEVRERRGARAELDDLVATLKREREAIATRLDALHAAERELSSDLHDTPGDAADRGTDQREVTMLEHFDERSARRLEAIDRAMDHAAQGRLGICDRCGNAIPPARMRALPGTTLCVACARAAETGEEPELPFERPPGGRAETGRPELGARVYTRFGEGLLLRVVPFGTCRRCGDVEGRVDPDENAVLCASDGCDQPLSGVLDRAIVRVGEREVYVDPVELRSTDAAPYD